MWNSKPSLRQQDMTCPFCGIACDDLTLVLDQGLLASLQPACEKAQQLFAAALVSADPTPISEGNRISLEVSLDLGAKLLAAARAPLFAGLVTDVNGMRATLELADCCGAVLDHLNGDALARNTRVLQDNGWMVSTLTEVRNRADLILIIGNQCIKGFPRLLERILLPVDSLFSPKEQRRLVFIGSWKPADLPAQLRDVNPLIIDAPPNQWFDIAGLLQCLLANRPISTDLDPLLIDRLEVVAKQLRAASYSVLTWSAAEMTFPHAEITINRLASLVKDLNVTTRSGVLPLAGSQGDVTANQVCTWQTGYPLRTSLQRGVPVHDSRLNRHQDLLERKETDLLVWISTLDPKAAPPRTDLPTIVLGHPGMALDSSVDLFIPTGVPGVDHPGHWYRSDAVCALPLGKLRESRLPAVGMLMRALQERLEKIEATRTC